MDRARDLTPRRNNMYDQLISSAIQQLCLGDELSHELADLLRRNLSIDAECPLDLLALHYCNTDEPIPLSGEEIWI
jgi:hypothetical protein